MILNGCYWKCVIVRRRYCNIGQTAQKYENILRSSYKHLRLNDYSKLVLQNILAKVLVSFVLFSLNSHSGAVIISQSQLKYISASRGNSFKIFFFALRRVVYIVPLVFVSLDCHTVVLQLCNARKIFVVALQVIDLHSV